MDNFWKGKKVFLTGGSGFIGSHLKRELYRCGAHVVATQHNNPVEINSRTSIIFGVDIADNSWLLDMEAEFKPDIVFHLAAYPIVTKSEENPDRAFATNVVGTYNIISAFPNSTIIVASTDKVYGRAKVPYTESTPLLGTHQVYEATKVAADVMAQSFFHRGQKLAITRACNIFGYDKEYTRIVPHIIKCLRFNETIEIRAGVDFVRDYLYVDDIVDGYLKLAEWRHIVRWQNWHPVAFNFGGHNLSVLDLMDEISIAMNCPYKYRELKTSTNEIKVQSLDWRLALETLNWKPSSLSFGIRKTVEEYARREG